MMARAAAVAAIRSRAIQALVLEDVLDEKVSIEAARRDYGVAIDPAGCWSMRQRRRRSARFDGSVSGRYRHGARSLHPERNGDRRHRSGRAARRYRREGWADRAVGHVRGGAADWIDAAGLVVSPGFIDIHSHSDYTLLVDPRAVSAMAQGVTLEVIGNCGFGCAPIRDPRSVAGTSMASTAAYRCTGAESARIWTGSPLRSRR